MSDNSLINETSKNGKHLVITCLLSDNHNRIKTDALIDCGATGYAFIDEIFARHHNFPLFPMKNPRVLEVIDGRPISSGAITHLARVTLYINQHVEVLFMFVTRLGHYPIVLGIPWLRHHDVAIRFSSNTITFDSEYCLNNCSTEPVIAHGTLYDPPDFHPSINAVSRALGPTVLEESEVRQLLPEHYHKFLRLFLEQGSSDLPPDRKWDHEIALLEEFTLPHGPLYSMSRDELLTLQQWLGQELESGHIAPSTSPASSPVLFVKQPDGSLRVCNDFRALNAGTVKNRYPLPLIREILARLSDAKYFTKLDIRNAYSLIRMKEGEEWENAVGTRYGLYQYNVMPFGLCNAPATFQAYINEALKGYLDVFCTAYLDNILIYSTSLEEHQVQHVSAVL